VCFSENSRQKSDAECDSEKILKIANIMREMGAKISTDQIEKAIRLYETAKILSQYGYFPLFKVLESIFVKRKEDLERLEKAIRYVDERKYNGAIHFSGYEEKLRGKEQQKLRRYGGEKELSWSDLERMSMNKLKRMKLDTAENIEKLNTFRLVEHLWNYYRTGNRGYLEMLEDQLIRNSQKRKGSYHSREGSSFGRKYRFIEDAVKKLIVNPEDPWALTILTREFGEKFTIDVVRFLILSGKRALAERLSSRLIASTASRQKRGRKRKGKEKSSRIDLRRTAFLSMRLSYPTVVYLSREREKGFVVLVDKSDSMRKHYSEAVYLIAQMYQMIRKLYLFDEDVRQLSLKKWHSKRYLIEEIIKTGVSGYTNITKAIRKIETALKPGEHLVIISDMEQTVADESYVTAINKLRNKNVRITLFTLEKHIPQLRMLLDPEVRIFPLNSLSIRKSPAKL